MPVFALVAMLVSPLVHQIEHGREHHRVRLEIAKETEHVHADFEALSSALTNVGHDVSFCVVCNIHLQIAQTDPTALAVRLPQVRTLGAYESPAAGIFSPHRAARAPPLIV